MNEGKQIKVFILGAGCSKDCGYPLGKSLTTQLTEFLSEIQGRFPTIEKSVSDTIDLAKAPPQFNTLDQLAKHLEDDFHEWRGREKSIVEDRESQQRKNLCDKQIIDAKIAVSTMFIAKENKAKSSNGWPNYQRFIASIFGGEPWQEAVSSADFHVITFNYDRLFELAFLDRFKTFAAPSTCLYGSAALNSGFSRRVNGCYEEIEMAAGRLNFLKLHGSAGWWVRKNVEQPDRRRYWHVPVESSDLQAIEDMLKKFGVYSHDTLNRLKAFPWEPLIAFPREKQDSLELREYGRPFDPYIRRIWDHAAALLGSATEIQIIGYSFSAIDSRHMVKELLSKATHCEKIVIQNSDIAAVQSELQSYPNLKGRVEFRASKFGECF